MVSTPPLRDSTWDSAQGLFSHSAVLCLGLARVLHRVAEGVQPGPLGYGHAASRGGVVTSEVSAKETGVIFRAECSGSV